jgi:hypothetical protein
VGEEVQELLLGCFGSLQQVDLVLLYLFDQVQDLDFVLTHITHKLYQSNAQHIIAYFTAFGGTVTDYTVSHHQ